MSHMWTSQQYSQTSESLTHPWPFFSYFKSSFYKNKVSRTHMNKSTVIIDLWHPWRIFIWGFLHTVCSLFKKKHSRISSFAPASIRRCITSECPVVKKELVSMYAYIYIICTGKRLCPGYLDVCASYIIVICKYKYIN